MKEENGKRKAGAEFLSRNRYKSHIPTLPFDPKSLKYPFPHDMLYTLKTTTLEKILSYSFAEEEMHPDLIALGVFIDVFIERRDKPMSNPDDESLLIDPDALREPKSTVKLPRSNFPSVFLKRNEYEDRNLTILKNLRQKPKLMFPKTKKGQIEVILETFNHQLKDITKLRNPRNENARALRILPIFPHFPTSGNEYSQVVFEETAQIQQDSILVPRKVGDQHMVGMYVPSDMNNYEKQYEFHHSSKVTTHESLKKKRLCFSFCDDFVHYHPIKTKSVLIKQRKDQDWNKTIALQIHPIQKQEQIQENFISLDVSDEEAYRLSKIV